ncbi:ammonia-forming cytochrome c nitrite reductase subunit c552 [Puniceicoccales bacterium CK1056]|uniref:nitrite reductase (cytochrome; ammonia-forming) n=1 Tax=Oceanipulchritudo coccoides TaxID=2706888 RepID=A0A6B2M0H3_9BACT|nr:ammonia-forming cytochrome c nitrite reductase subunit c552 [Oceanipulchritudo coccoides]NDV61265.1 ammonia-forming cytochrome c nitrite reductase subunit c552 [Oceanipulchritudo coccoides]
MKYNTKSGFLSRPVLLGLLTGITAVATILVVYILMTILEHKTEARSPYLRIVELDEASVDPALWGQNWPVHHDQYLETAGDKFYGGSSAMPASKLETDPWLKRLYSGYAFSLDYREARGHAYMLYDQVVTERVNQRQQSGACLHCHSSPNVLYRKVGLEAMGLPSDDETLAAEFNQEAIIEGFKQLSREPYHKVLAMLAEVPDGNPDTTQKAFEDPPLGGFSGKEIPEGHFSLGEVHPVSCIDCHDPKTMALRISRPGFLLGIADFAESKGEASIFPSIEKWRKGDRSESYDPNQLASRQEMRSFSCAQCHVEYYCASKDTLTFPWTQGLRAEDLEADWENRQFPDGSDFYDYKHGETGAKLFKAQHPEFELWSQGIHARSGVSCADCHMAYERTGAMKLSNHNVRSPMENINNACQTCHKVPEQELRNRVLHIQERTEGLKQRAAVAMTDMLDAILAAKAAGKTDEELEEIYSLQRAAMWRLDFISSENSRGFHADQESARILGESIDYSRKAQAAALNLRAPPPEDISGLPREPVKGVTPSR